LKLRNGFMNQERFWRKQQYKSRRNLERENERSGGRGRFFVTPPPPPPDPTGVREQSEEVMSFCFAWKKIMSAKKSEGFVTRTTLVASKS
jgi:hypothetical protein